MQCNATQHRNTATRNANATQRNAQHRNASKIGQSEFLSRPWTEREDGLASRAHSLHRKIDSSRAPRTLTQSSGSSSSAATHPPTQYKNATLILVTPACGWQLADRWLTCWRRVSWLERRRRRRRRRYVPGRDAGKRNQSVSGAWDSHPALSEAIQLNGSSSSICVFGVSK